MVKVNPNYLQEIYACELLASAKVKPFHLRTLFNLNAELRTSFHFISKPLAPSLQNHLKQFINWILRKGAATGITAKSKRVPTSIAGIPCPCFPLHVTNLSLKCQNLN